VLAFESDNPGAWLMHCHIPFHVSAGLGVQFLERMDEIAGGEQWIEKGCGKWRTFHQGFRGPWGNGSIFGPGDSGL
jgi:hypothetical protein